MTHDEIRELLGAYALDAVDPEEHRQVDEHLSSCPRCRAEVAEHRETAAMLAAVGAPAPDGVWDRISGELNGPIPIDRGRRHRNRWLTGVAAAAAIVSVFALTIDVARQRDELERLAGAVEEASLVKAANAALLDPNATRLTLASTDDSAEVDAVLLPDGTGYLVSDTLQPLPEARTYQLWALGGETPISAGVLGRDPAVVAFSADPGLTGLAISEEMAGGATSPSEVLLVGEVESA
ncbi:MAG: anti-sigma factor domain-containing protein [Actinomycetota bacterium]